MFTRRHGRDLAEIKALDRELEKRARRGLEQLKHIKRTQAAQYKVIRRGGTLRARPEVPPRAGIDGNGAGPLVAFVHIPKTAGGTVTSMFVVAYSRQGITKAGNFLSGPERTAAKLARPPGAWEAFYERGGRVSVGHCPYGVFREHLPEDTRYMTFLREPVDRVLSHFYRHLQRRNPNHAGSPKDLAKGRVKANSLEEAMVEMRTPALNNLATRFLSGHPFPVGELPASALEDAKANLRDFAFVGIQERFEESLVLLQRTLGLEGIPREAYEDRHVSSASGRPAVDEIAEEERALIATHNRLDAELYRFGVELFEQALAATDETR